MLRLLQCEWLKLKRSKLLLIGLFGTLTVPLFVFVKAVMNSLSNPEYVLSFFSLYDDAFMFLMLLSAPMVLTILHAWIISREYTDGTLKNIFVIPVSKTVFLCGKLLFLAILTFAFMFISWLEILVLAGLYNIFVPISDLTILSALFFLIRMLFGGMLLCATQTPFLYLTLKTRGSAAPLAAVAAASLVNVVLSNSPIAGFYPWSASYLLVTGRLSRQNCPAEVSISILLLLFVSGLAASLLRFQKEE